MTKETVTTTKVKRPYRKTGKFSNRRGPKTVAKSYEANWDYNNVLVAINALNDLSEADRNKAISFFN